MNKRMGLVVAVLLATLLQGCSSMAAKEEKAAAPATPAAAAKFRNLEGRDLAKFFEAYRLVLFTDEYPCGEADCNVKITVSLKKIDDKDYCFATLPKSLEFINTKPENKEKIITWTLDTGGLPVEFHKESGILEVDDGGKQFDADKARTNSVTFKAKNKHNDKGSEATYVPVILRMTGGLPELCATGDPKIVNN
ncbi:MAG TPA: hypothetical protein VKI18_16340 [Albitalea sp.]|nr:hypothetical protein [Albitalea sp.]